MEYLIKEHRRYKDFINNQNDNFEDFLTVKLHAWQSFVELTKLFCGEIKEKRVLEIGTGSGLCLSVMEQNDCLPYGIDISDNSLDYTKDVVSRYCKKSKILKMNGLKLGFQDSSFDIVYSNGLIEHLDEMEQYQLS